MPPDGSYDCQIMAIGEAPGKDENSRSRCFVGKTGKELNANYLPKYAGINREDIFLTNTVKCYPRFDRDMSDTIINSCSGYHLRGEIARMKNLKVVILMGSVACSLIGTSADMDHGIPKMANILGFERLCWPMYHPAAGMHDYQLMSNIMADWTEFGKWLRTGEATAPCDEFQETTYVRLRTAQEVRDSFSVFPLWYRNAIAIDTEYDPLPVGVNPYCLTYSYFPGTGFLVKAEDREAIAAFAAAMATGEGLRFKDGPLSLRKKRKGWPGPVLMHNSPADLPVMDALGIPIDRHSVVDTMQLSYNLMTMPQGLKTLAYRLVGMTMTEFDDLVTPYAVEYWLAYLDIVGQTQWPRLEPYMRLVKENVVEYVDGVPVTTGTTMTEKLYKPQSLSTKIKRLMTDYGKKPSPKIFKRIFDWDDKEWEPAVAKYGPIPKKSIRLVDDEQALLGYACRDSDATLRVFPELISLRKAFRRTHNV